MVMFVCFNWLVIAFGLGGLSYLLEELFLLTLCGGCELACLVWGFIVCGYFGLTLLFGCCLCLKADFVLTRD